MELKKQISEFTEIRHEVAKYIEQATTSLKEAQTSEDKLAGLISATNVVAYCIKEIAIKIDNNFSALEFLNIKVNQVISRLDELEAKKSEAI
jgi:hypothetical protein